MAIFLDACAIICWIEARNPQYGIFAEKLYKIRTTHGALPFAISHLSILECRIKPLREKNTELLQRYEQFFSAGNLIQVELTLEVIEMAAELRAHYHLATPDALQAASALSISEKIFFVTGDSVFKKIPNLTLLAI